MEPDTMEYDNLFSNALLRALHRASTLKAADEAAGLHSMLQPQIHAARTPRPKSRFRGVFWIWNDRTYRNGRWVARRSVGGVKLERSFGPTAEDEERAGAWYEETFESYPARTERTRR